MNTEHIQMNISSSTRARLKQIGVTLLALAAGAIYLVGGSLAIQGVVAHSLQHTIVAYVLYGFGAVIMAVWIRSSMQLDTQEGMFASLSTAYTRTIEEGREREKALETDYRGVPTIKNIYAYLEEAGWVGYLHQYGRPLIITTFSEAPRFLVASKQGGVPRIYFTGGFCADGGFADEGQLEANSPIKVFAYYEEAKIWIERNDDEDLSRRLRNREIIEVAGWRMQVCNNILDAIITRDKMSRPTSVPSTPSP